MDAKKSKLAHRTLLSIIRDEFSGDENEDLQEQKILQSFRIRELPNGGYKKDPYFELTISQPREF